MKTFSIYVCVFLAFFQCSSETQSSTHKIGHQYMLRGMKKKNSPHSLLMKNHRFQHYKSYHDIEREQSALLDNDESHPSKHSKHQKKEEEEEAMDDNQITDAEDQQEQETALENQPQEEEEAMEKKIKHSKNKNKHPEEEDQDENDFNNQKKNEENDEQTEEEPEQTAPKSISNTQTTVEKKTEEPPKPWDIQTHDKAVHDDKEFENVLIVNKISDFARNQLIKSSKDPNVMLPMMVGRKSYVENNMVFDDQPQVITDVVNNKLTQTSSVSRENKDHILHHYNPDKRYKPVTFVSDKEGMAAEGPDQNVLTVTKDAPTNIILKKKDPNVHQKDFMDVANPMQNNTEDHLFQYSVNHYDSPQNMKSQIEQSLHDMI